MKPVAPMSFTKALEKAGQLWADEEHGPALQTDGHHFQIGVYRFADPNGSLLERGAGASFEEAFEDAAMREAS